MSLQPGWWEGLEIAVVIPAYNVERELPAMLATIPAYVRWVIVVDDASTDATPQILADWSGAEPRLIPLRHATNRGVGGAMVTGFERAVALDATIVVKMDGDGQMAWEDLPGLLSPLVHRRADCAKANRFVDFDALRRMPMMRRMGNLGLSFLAKAASGYWTCFDPTNGFFALRREALQAISLRKLSSGYFFEISLLGELNLARAVVVDCPVPARYGNETSHLSIGRVLLGFPPRLGRMLLRRLVLQNFIYGFSMESVYFAAGVPMLLTGVVYGGYHWLLALRTNAVSAPGVVILPALLTLLGVQFLLAAMELDMRSEPSAPLCRGPDWSDLRSRPAAVVND